MKQLRELARPFPKSQIEQKPGGFEADYVAHHVVQQRLISILGAIPEQHIVREIYDRSPDGEKLTGVVMQMTATVDGQTVTVEEVGDTQGNEKTNGARLKNATSDAYKRCAMRMCLGLHLWAQEHYWLDAWWDKQQSSEDPPPSFVTGRSLGDVPADEFIEPEDVEDVGGGSDVSEKKKETESNTSVSPPAREQEPNPPDPNPQPEAEGEDEGAQRRRYFATLGDLANQNVDNPGHAGDWKDLAHTIVKRQYQVDSYHDIPADALDTFLSFLESGEKGVRERFVGKVNDEWKARQKAAEEEPDPNDETSQDWPEDSDKVAHVREELRKKFGGSAA